MKINYLDPPKKAFNEIYDAYKSCFLILDDVLANKNTHRIVYQDLIDLMKYGFDDENIRSMPIRFKIHQKDKDIYELQVTNFISNMILWRAFVDADSVDIMDASYIFDFKGVSLDDVIRYIDNKILVLDNIDLKTKNKIIDGIAYGIRAISFTFSILMGMGFSIYELHKLEEQYPELGEIMHGELDPSLQPREVEEELVRRTDRVLDILSSSQNGLQPLLLSGKNLNKDQLKEMFVKIGLKSDLNGNTIPYVINCNIIVDGIKKPSYHLIESIAARKSLIMTKTRMGEPGAFSKKIATNTTSQVLRKDNEHCNSVTPVYYHIKNEKILMLLDKRYYYHNGKLKLLNYEKDKHLIGQIIPFTSPITCSSKEGICEKCYGSLFEINKDLFSVGAYSALKESEPYGQGILSSKHSQVTSSNLISFCADFSKFLSLSSNQIELGESLDNLEGLYIEIKDLIREEDITENIVYKVYTFNIVDTINKRKYTIYEENESAFFLTADFVKMYMTELKKREDKALKKLKKVSRKEINAEPAEEKGIMISLEDIEEAEINTIFNIEIKNKELTKSLEDIEKLLNSKEHLGCKTISEMCQKMLELKIDSGINYNAVHHELIIAELVRKKSNEYQRADFSLDGDQDDYTILKLDDAAHKNPSPILSLAGTYLRRQLVKSEFYDKTDVSHLDALFMTNLYNYN